MPGSRTKNQAARAGARTKRKPAPPRKKAGQNAARRKKRATASKTPRARAPRAEALPSWSDLESANKRNLGPPRAGGFIERISTVRFGLLLAVVAAACTLYVGHVHATQEALAELQQVRRDNLRLHLKLDRLQGDFDRATSPAVVLQRARALGLEESIAYGPTIWEPESR